MTTIESGAVTVPVRLKQTPEAAERFGWLAQAQQDEELRAAGIDPDGTYYVSNDSDGNVYYGQ